MAACDAGHLDMVEMMLPIVETSPLGINCKDGFGMTGLMAALEKGRLEVVDRLLDEWEIDLDFTQQDFQGRNVLDMVITSPSDYFMDYVLEELSSTLVKKGELSSRFSYSLARPSSSRCWPPTENGPRQHLTSQTYSGALSFMRSRWADSTRCDFS